MATLVVLLLPLGRNCYRNTILCGTRIQVFYLVLMMTARRLWHITPLLQLVLQLVHSLQLQVRAMRRMMSILHARTGLHTMRNGRTRRHKPFLAVTVFHIV